MMNVTLSDDDKSGTTWS